MKDSVFLVVAAVACSSGAWAFWHYLGSDALTSLLILALVSVIADNIRLRRQISNGFPLSASDPVHPDTSKG
jgi:hypothetical protein